MNITLTNPFMINSLTLSASLILKLKLIVKMFSLSFDHNTLNDMHYKMTYNDHLNEQGCWSINNKYQRSPLIVKWYQWGRPAKSYESKSYLVNFNIVTGTSLK